MAALPSLELYVQPIIEMSSAEVVGWEMLSRWEGEDTEEVFARARLNGTLVELCRDVITAGLEVVGRVPKGNYLSINVTSELLETIDPQRSRIAEISATDRARLVIELSEQSPGSLEKIFDLLMLYRSFGIRFAIDDVGSQYGNIYRIVDLNPDIIKIDRTLVARGVFGPQGRAAIRAIVGMAQELRISVVAEGIETTQEAALCEKLGVRYGQGYLFGRPKPVDEYLPI